MFVKWRAAYFIFPLFLLKLSELRLLLLTHEPLKKENLRTPFRNHSNLGNVHFKVKQQIRSNKMKCVFWCLDSGSKFGSCMIHPAATFINKSTLLIPSSSMTVLSDCSGRKTAAENQRDDLWFLRKFHGFKAAVWSRSNQQLILILSVSLDMLQELCVSVDNPPLLFYMFSKWSLVCVCPWKLQVPISRVRRETSNQHGNEAEFMWE